MTNKQKWGLALVIVILLLIYFLYYYFVIRVKKEKCPDGSVVPASGNCPVSSSGTVPVVNNSGCATPSSYITNAFPLQLGMKGDLVKQLQIRLNNSYGGSVSEDGFFGCITLAAVQKAFNVSEVNENIFKDKVQGSLSL